MMLKQENELLSVEQLLYLLGPILVVLVGMSFGLSIATRVEETNMKVEDEIHSDDYVKQKTTKQIIAEQFEFEAENSDDDFNWEKK